MKGLLYTVGVVAMLLLSVGCEKIVELNVVDFNNKLVVNAVLSPDTVVMAAIGEVRDIEFEDIADSGINGTFLAEYVSSSDYTYRNRTFSLKRSSIQSKINAYVVLNGIEKFPMWLNADTLDSRFVSECRPQVGDKVELFVSVDTVGYLSVRASAEIPPQQRIEVVKHEVVYSENAPMMFEGYEVPDNSGEDSIMRVTLKINDPANERNYYRLRVVGAGNKNATELFSCDDQLFYDPDLVNKYGFIIPAYFSNVFNDDLIDGKEYTFTVESRKRKEPNARTIIELQSISSDLYYYIKSYMKYRIAEFDSFDVPIGIYSNVENGWGILGAASRTQLVVMY